LESALAIDNPSSAHGHKSRVTENRTVLFDEEGFLVDPQSWTQAIAEALAREAGLPGLGELHWKTILFMREFYVANGKTPLNKEIKKGTSFSLLEIESAFPGGIRHGARRIAGLPNPKSC